MAGLESLKNWILNRPDEAPDEGYEYDQPEVETEEVPLTPNGRRNNVVSLHPTAVSRIMIEKPQDFEGARKIVDHLKNRRPVVINIENKDIAEAQRLVDFISGAVYAMDGHIQKIARGIFVLTPNNMEIALEEHEEEHWSRFYGRS